MATTNFKPWNPAKANQEDDSTYAADSQRTGGASAGSIFASALANKLFYQLATWVYAMATMMQAKGFSTSDADSATLAAVLANLITTADLRTAFVAVSYSATPTYDLSKGGVFGTVLAGNITPVITNVLAGQRVTFMFKQDATGSRTVTWPAAVNGGVQPDPTPNTISSQTFDVYSDGTLQPATGNMSPNGLNATPIGQKTPAAASFITPASTDNTTKAATTAWAQLGFAFVINANNGYIKLPDFLGGFIVQWGNVTGVGASAAVTFPLAFPNACLAAVLTIAGAIDRTVGLAGALTTTGMTIGTNGTGEAVEYIVIGH